MLGACANGIFALWAAEIRRWVKPVYSKWFHNAIGIIAFVIGMASIAYSYDMRQIRGQFTVEIRIALKWATAITAALSLVGAIRSFYDQTKGVVMTTINCFSRSESELPLKQ